MRSGFDINFGMAVSKKKGCTNNRQQVLVPIKDNIRKSQLFNFNDNKSSDTSKVYTYIKSSIFHVDTKSKPLFFNVVNNRKPLISNVETDKSTVT